MAYILAVLGALIVGLLGSRYQLAGKVAKLQNDATKASNDAAVKQDETAVAAAQASLDDLDAQREKDEKAYRDSLPPSQPK